MTDIALEGNTLFTMDSNNILRAIDISNFDLVERDSLILPPSGGKLFVGNDIAYVTAENSGRGGLVTADVSDLDNLMLISPSDVMSPFVGPDTDIAINGSDLGILVGSRGQNLLTVLDLSDPELTNEQLFSFNLPAAPESVAIAAGIAFVANGDAGLVITNYLSFDSQGISPTITLSSQVTDADPLSPGIQVVEGTSLPIQVDINDDVQLRNTQLIVDGVVVTNDVSFPFEFTPTVPATPGDTLTIEARATDTGGNTGTSNILTFEIVEDIVAPVVIDTTPEADTSVFFTPSIDVRFSESLDTDLVNLSGIDLTFLGADGIVGGSDDVSVDLSSVETRTFGRRLAIFPASILETGNYELVIDPSIIADRAGNALADSFSFEFTIRPASDIQAESGLPTITRAPSANVGQDISFIVPWQPENTRIRFSTINGSGLFSSRIISPFSSNPDTQIARFIVPNDAVTGDLLVYGTGSLNFTGLPNWTVTEGFVDLVGTDAVGTQFSDILPSDGLYLDLDGSASNAGRIESNTTFSLAPGDYELRLDLAGSQRGDTNTVTVSLGSEFSEDFTLDSSAPFTTITRVITITDSFEGKLSFDHAGGDNFGLLLDNVFLTDLNTETILFEDNFALELADGTLPLQIVPTITNVDLTRVNSSTASFSLNGTGLIEDQNSIYSFGSESIIDINSFSGPDVFANNTRVNVSNLTFSEELFDAVTVTTTGGTSAPYSFDITEIESTAFIGTAADITEASANTGQSITLRGSNLSTATDVVMRYVDDNGNLRAIIVNPSFVNADGSEANLEVPNFLNGAFELLIPGSANQPLLQVVPTISSVDITSTNRAFLVGSGIGEGDGSYNFVGGTLVDPDGSSSTVDVFSSSTRVNLNPLPVHGFGELTVTTTAGTSNTITPNFLSAGLGDLRDIAFDGTHLWLAPLQSGQQLHQVSLTTGETLNSIDVPLALDTSTNRLGLQVLPSSLMLADINSGGSVVNVPAGSLLLSNADFFPDRIFAIDPNNGDILATLELADNITLVAVVYDPGDGGHLYVLDGNPNEVVEIDPTTGARIEAGSFATPFDINTGALALDPGGETLWIGSNQTNIIAEVQRDGTVVRTIDLSSQGISNEITGLAFDSDGNLLASSTLGVVYRLELDDDLPAPAAPTLTGIVGTAVDGTETDSLIASANAGQNIELVGTNLSTNTPVIFSTRDNNGNEGTITITPTAVNEAGTRAQIRVPDLAQTGEVTLAPIGGTQNLGFGSNADAIYRNINLSFIANSDTAQIKFVDSGLQGINDESWGLDNVQVALANTPEIAIFEDNFEGGANSEWSLVTTDNSLPTSFTEFSGRFSSQQQRLSLSGLTAGEEYLLDFDLYIFDSWEGSGNNGPDFFNVLIDDEVAFQETFSNVAGRAQSFQPIASGSVDLQIVPVISGINGRPGLSNTFDLFGSGFMEGASTITIGGTVINDQFTNFAEADVLSLNSLYRLISERSIEGPITVETAGGSFQIEGPTFAEPTFIQFTGIETSTTKGSPTNTAIASVNTGQTITLLGEGFISNSTIVQFEAVDAQGVAGLLSRTGTASSDGRQLIVEVPVFARSGMVRVVGDESEFELQVVPTLRSVGGTIANGNEIILEGTGLVEDEVNITIDGQAVALSEVTTVGVIGSFDQQVVVLTVPNGVSDGVITVTTDGGSFTFTPVDTQVITITDLGEIGDTLATAETVTLGNNSLTTVTSTLGDSGDTRDVDMLTFEGNAGDLITLSAARLEGFGGFMYLRLFDADGNQLAADGFSGNGSNPRILNFTLPSTGAYFVGVSGWNNTNYDPTVVNSGRNGGSGDYQLNIERLSGTLAATSLTSIIATANSGTATRSGVAAANTGQTITLNGEGLINGDRVIFTTIDSNGTFSTTVVTPTSIESDGSSLAVVVPITAVSGTVRLERENGGLFLQIVPTLSDIDQGANDSFHNDLLQARGTGFAEGATTINFGSQSLTDPSTSSSTIDVFFNGTNSSANILVPNGVASGPISVTTLGGTSAVFGVAFDGIVAVADSGTPTNVSVASANPGQVIQLTGSNFDTTTDVVFLVSNDNGTVFERVVRPSGVNGDGTELTVIVPTDAVTGLISIVGDQNSTQALLQIVPTITNVDLTNVNSSTVNFSLSGTGFIEGSNTRYNFGSRTTIDASRSNSFIDSFFSNTRVNVSNLTFSEELFDAVTVTTTGGTSAPYSFDITEIESTAFIGTAADITEASANTGQSITLRGSNLSTATDVVMRYVDDNGNLRAIIVNPSFVNADGSEANLEVPNFLNGAFELLIPGSANQPLLQVVPTISSVDITSTNRAFLVGSGIGEGDGSYNFVGGTLVDPDGSSSTVDVFSSSTQVNLNPLPVHGFGELTVTTTAGTSNAITPNFLSAGLGDLRDIAFDGTHLWLAPRQSGQQLHQVSLTTGETLNSIDVPLALGTSTFTNGLGLQVLLSSLMLADINSGGSLVNVPAGSLLLSNFNFSPDRIFAIDPNNGDILATLELTANIDPVAVVYDPGDGGHLYVLDGNPNEVVEIDPTTGARIEAGSFATPFDINTGALALDPGGETLWIGSNPTNIIAEVQRDGTVVRTIDLSSQGISNEITGLAFDSDGNLLASSTLGVVYRLETA